MGLKRIIGWSILVAFLISFPFHFMYAWFPNVLSSFFFPVNESVWEHIKIIYNAILVGGLFQYVMLKRNNIVFNNFPLLLWISSFLGIIIFLLMYLPLYYVFGEVLWISILQLLIVYIMVGMIGYYVLQMKHYSFLNKLAPFMLVLGYGLFIYWTYRPLYHDLFFDPLNGKYGISEYICHH